MLYVVPAVEDELHHTQSFIDVLVTLLDRLTWATTMIEVNLAAGVAADALNGATLMWDAPATLRAVET